MIIVRRLQWLFLVLAFFLARATLFGEPRPEDFKDPRGALSSESFVIWSNVAWLVSDFYFVHHTWPDAMEELLEHARQVTAGQAPIASELPTGNIKELFGRISHLELKPWQNNLFVTARFRADGKSNGVTAIFHPGKTSDEIMEGITLTMEAERSATSAQKEQAIPSGRVLEFGIYRKGEDRGTPRTVLEATAPRVWEGGDPLTLIKKTDQIPAVLGTGFYFISEITGLAHGSTDVLWVVKHPEIRKPDGTISTGYAYTRSLESYNGRCRTQDGYILDHDYEVAEGTWSFSFVYQGKTLVEQTFTLRKP